MLPLATVKALFPLWTDYCDADDAILQREMDRAGEFMIEYIPDLTADNITNPLKLHFMNVARKRCFDLKRGDREFEHRPGILRDYDDTVKRLELYRKGELAGPDATEDSTDIVFTSKTRRFGEWFQ